MQVVLEVIITRSGGVKNNPWLHVILQPCHPDPGLHFLKITEWVAKHVNKKWQSSDVFFRLLFYSKLDFRRLPSVRSFILREDRLFRGMSAGSFSRTTAGNGAYFYSHLVFLLKSFSAGFLMSLLVIQSFRSWREFNVTRILPRLSGLSHLETFTCQDKIWPQLSYKVIRSDLTDRLTHLGWYLTYQANVMKLKWEIIYTGGLPHLQKWVTSPVGSPHLHVNRP